MAGIVVGVVALALIAGGGWYWYTKKYKKGTLCPGKEPLAGGAGTYPPVNGATSSSSDLSAVQVVSNTQSMSCAAAGSSAPLTAAMTTADAMAEHKAIKAKLREYEVAFEAREGRKPRKRDEWGDMWPDYERYAALRQSPATDP